MKSRYYLVAANTPFNNSLLTYKYISKNELKGGEIVKIPLGKREVLGCVLEETIDFNTLKNLKEDQIKDIHEIIEEFFLESSDLDLLKWISQYYHHPLGLVIENAIPTPPKKFKAVNFIQGNGNLLDLKMNLEQERIVNKISLNLNATFSKWLIHGVTGSGKTLIYLNLILSVIKNKQSVLFLLPEINLTPQFLKTFETYLDAPIYSYNSNVSKSDKFGLWKLLQNDKNPKLIVGVRSSVFLPIKNLGLIIVDEEHDQSFKQSDRCTYNARDVAIKKASVQKIPIVLGSATPMIETYNNFIETQNYFSLEKRALADSLPEIEMIDMRGRLKIESEKIIWPYTAETIKKMEEAFFKDEQILVFINRLGYANYLQCNSCGHQFSCPNCSSNLKLFKKKKVISCQTCNFKKNIPEMCPECMNLKLIPMGFGTEKALEILQSVFPSKKIGRFDRDEIKNFKTLEKTLNDFHEKKIDVLVGTQMLAKGHNFKNVNLVVILGIDSQLNFPDFRSNERVYQTLTQVSGRAGRYGDKASVLILTLAPENKVFHYLKNHTFHEFYRDEIPTRKLCSSPPFNKIILLYLSSKSQLKVMEESIKVGDELRVLTNSHFNNVEILGPRPSTVEKKVNMFTWSIVVRSTDLNQLHNLVNTFSKNTKLRNDIVIKIDVDPYIFD